MQVSPVAWRDDFVGQIARRHCSSAGGSDDFFCVVEYALLRTTFVEPVKTAPLDLLSDFSTQRQCTATAFSSLFESQL